MPEDGHQQVWILGLNHSGTTILWRSWRADSRFLCFDEPLTGDIAAWYPQDNAKKTFGEYRRLFAPRPTEFWDLYRPIYPLQELDSEFTVGQERYLRFLLEQSQRVVIDETHLHLHILGLTVMTPKAYVIHLYRRASAFVTSHMIPSWSRRANWSRRIGRRLRHGYNQWALWNRNDFLPGMRRGEVIGQHAVSKFGLMLSEAGYDAEAIMAAPTVVRLLAYWHYHYHYLEREGPRHFGAHFTSLRYEDFATDPAGTMRRLYRWVELTPPPNADYPEVHPSKPPFRERDRRWRAAARVAGFTDQEIESLL